MKLRHSFWLAAQVAIFASLAHAAATLSYKDNSKCKILPSDPQWPDSQAWSQLNNSVGGRLIKSKPLAEICHGPSFDQTACINLKSEWLQAPIHFEDPVSIQAPYWLNNSCSPFTAPNSPCTLGNLVSYTVNVSSAEDVASAFQFAKERKIRFAVKNSGHDYIGRSTGQGALGVWMHNLKDISFFNYTSLAYTGPAVRLGAGVQAFEAYAAAHQSGVRIVGGYCPTVGIVGGYVQGAGHGPLASEYGLAADNTLEFEVVTSTGEHLVASPTQNEDLFWALNGGGGGAYAVVLSQVTKVFPDGPVAGASLSFNNTNDDTFWSAVSVWQDTILGLNNIPGLSSVFAVTNATFSIDFATWPDHNASDMAAVLDPFRAALTERNISVVDDIRSSSSYYDHYTYYTSGVPYGTYPTNDVLGGRLIPRAAVQDNPTAILNAIRNITRDGRYLFYGGVQNATHERVGNSPGANAVLPVWRDTLVRANPVATWDPTAPLSDLDALQADLTYNIEKQLKEVTPGAGAYMNEATFGDPDWKADYYGDNYDKLLAIKQRYDPDFMLYGPAVVGNDYWSVATDGRLCRSS